MLDMHAPRPPPAHVTVRFGDGAHSFRLMEGATMTELADKISDLRTRHDGAPISIAIEFGAARAGSARQLSIDHSLSH